MAFRIQSRPRGAWKYREKFKLTGFAREADPVIEEPRVRFLHGYEAGMPVTAIGRALQQNHPRLTNGDSRFIPDGSPQRKTLTRRVALAGGGHGEIPERRTGT